MYRLYGGKFTRALIVQMVMAEGDIDYEYIDIDIINNENLTPEFLSINPAGHVPVLVKADGEALYETPAINLYLSEEHNLTDLMPEIGDPDRGLFLSGLFFLSGDLEPMMKQYFYPNRIVIDPKDEPLMKQKSLDAVMTRFAVIEQRLQMKGPFHLGERFSLLDIILSFWVEYIHYPGSFEGYPAILRCIDLVRNRPSLKTFFNELDGCREAYTKLQAQGGGAK